MSEAWALEQPGPGSPPTLIRRTPGSPWMPVDRAVTAEALRPGIGSLCFYRVTQGWARCCVGGGWGRSGQDNENDSFCPPGAVAVVERAMT